MGNTPAPKSAKTGKAARPQSKVSAEFDEAIGTTGFDRMLAGAIVGVLGFSVIAFILLMVGSAGHWLQGQFAASVMMIPFVGLPIGIILMIVLTIRMARKRSRAAKAQR